jgi:hypothetical protein
MYRVNLHVSDRELTNANAWLKVQFGVESAAEPLQQLSWDEVLDFSLSWTEERWVTLEMPEATRRTLLSRQPTRSFFFVSGAKAVLQIVGAQRLECTE